MATRSDEPGPFPTRLARLAAILTAVVAAVLLGVGFFTPARSGPYCASVCLQYPYASASQYFPGDYLWMVPGIALVPIVLLLVTCLQAHAPPARKVLGILGTQLATGYAVVILTTYLTQILVVGRAYQSGHADAVAIFSQYDPDGFFVAMECLGYLLLSSALVVFAGTLGRSRLERAVRWTFVAGFAASLIATIAVVLSGTVVVLLEVAMITIIAAILVVGGPLLSSVFHSAEAIGADPAGTG